MFTPPVGFYERVWGWAKRNLTSTAESEAVPFGGYVEGVNSPFYVTL